jgi:DNA polymerase III psi subunit
MSDTRDQLMLRQRQKQQRQILAMMGIEQWVLPDSATLNMASITEPAASTLASMLSADYNVHTGISAHTDPSDPSDSNAASDGRYSSPNLQVLDTSAQQPVTLAVIEANAERLDSGELSAEPLSADSPSIDDPNVYHIDSTRKSASINPTINNPLTQAVEPLLEQVNSANIAEPLVTVAPFDLQGGRYGNWVLLVDIQALNSDSEKLWQNISRALNLSHETSSFPICAGMDSAELANASFAGYVFKIGRSEEVLVGALTALPDALVHPHLQAVPSLDEMLADSTLKRQFWQQLSKPL